MLEREEKRFSQLLKDSEVRIQSYFRIANEQVMKALRYGYVGRKRKKRDFRRLWITRINAASRMHGTNYSSLISKLKVSQISLNRKMLAQMAVNDMDFICSTC